MLRAARDRHARSGAKRLRVGAIVARYMAVRRKLRNILIAVGSLLLILAIGAGTAFHAARQVPRFYREATSRKGAAVKRASDQMLQQATALASDVRNEGQWQAIFTADQINGWLAVDLVKNHSDLIPREVREPRVEIREREATIACRYEGVPSPTVYSLTFDVYLSDVETIALHIHRARAGNLPIPLRQVLDGISEAARNLDLPIEWRQKDGDPVALITVTPEDEAGREVELDKIQLRDGELLISGRTIARSKSPAAPQAERLPPPDVESPRKALNQ